MSARSGCGARDDDAHEEGVGFETNCERLSYYTLRVVR